MTERDNGADTPVHRSHRRGLLRVALVAIITIAMGCGSDTSSESQGSEASPARTVTPSTKESTAVATTSPNVPSDVTIASDSTVQPETASPSAIGPDPAAWCTGEQHPAIAAYDRATGVGLWATCAPEVGFRGLVGATEESVYFVDLVNESGFSTPQLVAAGVNDGAEQWRVSLTTSAPLASGPAVGSGVVVAQVDDPVPAVVGLDPDTGAVLWQTDLGEQGVGNPPGVVATTETSVIVFGPATQTSAASKPVVAVRGLDRASGELRWQIDRELGVGSTGQPRAVVDGEVVVLQEAELLRLDPSNGDVLWEVAAPRVDEHGVCDVAEGVVLLCGQDDPTVAIDVDNGETLWERNATTVYDAAIAASDGATYVVDGGNIVAYGLLNGAERWTTPMVDYSWPWLADGDTVFAMWHNLEARSTIDGSVVWATSYPTDPVPTGPTPRMVSIAASQTAVYVSFTSGATGGD